MPPEDRKPAPNLEELGRKLDRELQQVIDYLNDEVVPTVRTGSSKALRTAAEKLARIADYMEREAHKR